MRIASGVTDQYIYFVAVDATDFTTRETGLSSFTVYRSRNGGTAAAMTTPTINETDATNMPGVYELLLDEDMTIDSGDETQEMAFHITHAGMAPVTRTIELYRPKITAGNTLDVTATGAAGIDWGNVENQSTSVDLSATAINLCDTVTTNTDMRGTDSAFLAASAPTNFSDLSITATTGLVDITQTAADKAWGTTTRVLTANTNLNDPTAAAIADAVWDEAQAGHVGAGTFGEIATETAAILADTNELQTDWANGGRLDLILDARAAQTTADAIETDTQDIQSRLPAALVGGRIDATVDGTGMESGAIDAILTRQMTEAYAADGAAPTIAQALMLIQQSIGEFSISGTTLTVKKLDGTTTAATFTLDDGTNPTSITRAT